MRPKQGRKPMTLRLDHLLTYDPLTENQDYAYRSWRSGDNLVLYGTAGTGKTFIGIYLALEEVLDKALPQNKLVIVRSVVPTREIGYLPGTLEEKMSAYVAPYRAIMSEMFEDSEAYDKLIEKKQLEIISTSHIRGTTIDDAIILVDECQNLNFHELDSIITRVGRNSRIIFSGDHKQSDFYKEREKEGVMRFLNIVEQLKNFDIIEFTWTDIVRSDFVRDYIMTKEMLGY